jgi:hypothetical protein
MMGQATRPAQEVREGTSAPTGWTTLVIYAGYLLFLTGLFVIGAEVALRARGLMPWSGVDTAVSSIRVEPGERFFQPHPVLGYAHIPGKFVVTLGGGEKRLRFNVTHLSDTLRITRPVEGGEPGTAAKDEIWIFGCSLTHGWSVNDEQTYAWLLQERFADLIVVNFGVSGYGTVHSLLQFREALKRKTPKVAVLAYAYFHDERNTFARTRRKAVAPWNRLGPLVQPYARLDASDQLQYYLADVEYSEFPLMRQLAFAHFLETSYARLERIWLRSHAVSEALVLEMARLAREQNVHFIVANISGPPSLSFPEHARIPVVIDIAVDLARPENTNMPFDPHPSALAHAQYAARLGPVISAALAANRP